METFLWGISAFALYRVPPVVREHLFRDIAWGTSSHADGLAVRRALRSELGTPLHVLVHDRQKRRATATTMPHLWEGDLPFGSTMHMLPEVEDVLVASPLLALLTMASSMSETHLIMALCELCGTFSVYEPSAETRAWLQAMIDAHALPFIDGWKPVLTRTGALTSLWQRPPVASVAEAQAFADRVLHRRGRKRFLHAVANALDGAASPFEVQAALRFGLSRRMGGSGFSGIKLNERIPLSPAARLIASKSACYADLLIEGKFGTRPLIVECQRKLIHNSTEQALADGERLMALQSMGYTVIPLTYEQLVTPAVYANVERYIAKELGLRLAPKSAALEHKELELRRDLFINWTKLGQEAL